MNDSGTYFSNKTEYGYNLNEQLATESHVAILILVFYLVINVSPNCWIFYKYTRRSHTGDRFGNVLLSSVDFTFSVLASSSYFVLKSNPVNLYGDSLCALMLGSNMLMANLSGFCVFSILTYRYILFRYPLIKNINEKRKLLTVIGILLVIGFSSPCFKFYGETDITVRFQNVTVSGKICGVSGRYDNQTLIRVYPIVVSIIYAFVVLYSVYIVTYLELLFYRGIVEIKKSLKIPQSKISNSCKNIDKFADKDFSVLDSDATICNSCDEQEFKTKYDTKIKMKSAYEKMLEIDLSISEIMNRIDETSSNLAFRGISKYKITAWCIAQPCLLLVMCYLCVERTIALFTTPKLYKEIVVASEVEYSFQFIFDHVIFLMANPACNLLMFMFTDEKIF